MQLSNSILMVFTAMKQCHIGILASIVCVFLEIVANCPAAIVDQEFVGPNDHPLGANIGEGFQFVAMTYTAGITGTLTGINVDVLGYHENRLHVAVHEVSQGAPTATILGETLLTTVGAPLSQLITFPNQISQSAGMQYAIVVDYQTAPGDGLAKGLWSGNNTGGYSEGQLFFSNNSVDWRTDNPDQDLHFRTYCDPVPEPSTLLLLGMGASGLLAFVWRRFC